MNIYLIAAFFSNKRRTHESKIRLLRILGVSYYDIDYLNEEYHDAVKGYENESENGARCTLCFNLRLKKTAKIAKENGFDFFGTTLTVSPHKNSLIINALGMKIEKDEGILFLLSDFKKEDGYKRSVELAKEYDLYRQDYCGCLYSKNERGKKDE